MTNEKAKEYFSAYSEGTLDAGLARALEAKLNADSGLREEYTQFEATLKELESLRFEEIEVPFDLSERISAAIDRSIYDKKQTAQPGFANWFRNLAFAGLAAAAIFGAYLTINMTGKGPVGTGSGIPTIKSEQIEFRQSDAGVSFSYMPGSKHIVTIDGGSEGQQKMEVGPRGWTGDLKNDQPDASAFTVTIDSEATPSIVVVPGTKRSNVTLGRGSVLDLAKAVANRYGVVVVLVSSNIKTEVSWELSGTDAFDSLNSVIKTSTGLNTDVKDKIITIRDN